MSGRSAVQRTCPYATSPARYSAASSLCNKSFCSLTMRLSRALPVLPQTAARIRSTKPRQLPTRLLHTTSGRRDYEAQFQSPVTSTELETLKITTMEAPHTGVIKVISFNRPAARNAISRQLLHELGSEIEAIHGEGARGPTRALILASEVDECFCAGADLKERKTMSVEETRQFLTKLRHIFYRIQTLPVPSIASVTGMALGGGLELALCTHLRVFSSTALVGLPETRLAIIPGGGGTYRLPMLIGPSRAMDLVFTGKRVGPLEALEWGLCNYVAGTVGSAGAERYALDKTKAREAALEKSVDVAMQIADGGPVGLRAAVQAMNHRDLTERHENDAYEMVLGTQDRLEALKAFAEKRPPSFKGE